jgi:phosphosulfolactate synthase
VVSAAGVKRVLFEAPQRAQQAWLIRRYGPNVNIGNVWPAAALSVEALRLGLRSDTVGAVGVGTSRDGGPGPWSKEA